jgi:hypothetical protein
MVPAFSAKPNAKVRGSATTGRNPYRTPPPPALPVSRDHRSQQRARSPSVPNRRRRFDGTHAEEHFTADTRVKPAGRLDRSDAGTAFGGPAHLRKEVIDAMGVFGTTVGAIDAADAQVLQGLADVASISLLQERTISRGEALTGQLQGALSSRIIIVEQAEGAIAQAQGVTVGIAFNVMRAYARRCNRRLSDIANLVVTDLSSLPDLTPS